MSLKTVPEVNLNDTESKGLDKYIIMERDEEIKSQKDLILSLTAKI